MESPVTPRLKRINPGHYAIGDDWEILLEGWIGHQRVWRVFQRDSNADRYSNRVWNPIHGYPTLREAVESVRFEMEIEH